MESYDSVDVQSVYARVRHEMTVAFAAAGRTPGLVLHIWVDAQGITLSASADSGYALGAKGHILHGDSGSCIALNTKDTTTDAIRGAIGPATAWQDNAVYNTMTDSAFVMDGCHDLELFYDWTEKKYGACLRISSDRKTEGVRFSVQTELLSGQYNIPFVPRKNRGPYKTPPAGWMTWYAVKFNACEEAVLKNVRFQQEHLKTFGADTVWVDWEWCHQRYERERFDGVNNFNPDPKKYPNGLGPVAQEIKKAGFVPALWIGFTNDVCLTDYEREHPEISLSHHETWSGLYYYDISHPEYLNGFLPKAVGQVKEWGYEVVKYDTLPNCIAAHEKYHGNMHRPDITTYQAYRAMILKTRELLSEDCYMLSCSGSPDVVLWGAGVFDAARVGPDLFEWEGFLTTLDRVRQFYPLHNIVLYNDPDNVVLREEFSTYAQAVSRVSMVSLLGLPLTFGDDLPSLPANRLDLLKRALPTMDVHPADFNHAVSDGKTQLISLNIALPFEQYSVAGLMNLTAETRIRDISLGHSLRLKKGEYLVYDYFRKEFLGVCEDSIQLSVEPYETRVLSFRRKTGKPQIVSTSRHITQGAAELKSVLWEEAANALSVTAALVEKDPYELCVFVPDSYRVISCYGGKGTVDGNLLTIRVVPEKTGEHRMQILFYSGE